ncbi:MAG: hypothetical protein GY711_03740 [bacterium]|nr:hypothetical protein [bacterium]
MSFLLEGSGARTGDFERREQFFLIVAPGPFTDGSSEIRTVEVSTVDGKTRTTMRIRPQDIHGNYLGADQAVAVSGISTGSAEPTVVTDAGNGWYELVFTTDEADPVIEISIGDTVAATGRPTEIDVPEPRPIVSSRPPAGAEDGTVTRPPVDRTCRLCYIIAACLLVLVVLLTILLMKKR